MLEELKPLIWGAEIVVLIIGGMYTAAKLIAAVAPNGLIGVN